jgi:hypothetical protein
LEVHVADEQAKPIWSLCARCNGSRCHEILCKYEESARDEYHVTISYLTLKCLGCHSISFRKEVDDYEQGYSDPEQGGIWIPDTTVSIYPKSIEGHHEINESWLLPRLVRRIHKQSLLAIREDAGILAGLGLRATIEAVCNNLTIAGANLERRISALSTQGLISKKDAERLHAIRFLGNDAAHDIKEPTKGQLSVALKIVEHLLNTVYILEKEASEQLDTIVSDFETFSTILIESLQDFNTGEELSLAKFVGKFLRRVKDSLSTFEAELVQQISASNFTKLKLGQVIEFGQPPKPMQLFIVS